MSLFRKEAISHQSERLTGVVTLAQPLSIKITVLILFAIAIAIIVFLFNGEYSRKETVRGFLMPSKGIIKSYAPNGGTVSELLVSEGQQIKKGQVLAKLIINHRNEDGSDLSEDLSHQIGKQINLLEEEITQHQTLHKQELLNLKNRSEALKKERWALKQQYSLALEKLTLLGKQQQQFDQLNSQGFLSKIDKERQQQLLLEAKQEKQDIARLLVRQNNELAQVAFEQTNTPQQFTLRTNNLKRQIAELQRQLSQLRNNYSYSISATHTGIVTGIQVVEGETLSNNKPLLQILPEGSELVAELLLPTRSAGFVEKGQNTRLRFDAFPYQRFGFINSEITRIDRALIAPNEVQLPVAIQEPVYRLQAKLTKQQVTAYGKSFSLKSGMLFDADIVLEQRTLIEWLLEPIYSLKGRMS